MIRRLLDRNRHKPEGFDFKDVLGGYEPPSFPGLVSRAMDLLLDPAINMARVAEVIELDPGVSSRMLRLVNSAAISPRSKVSSVHQAAVMLGRNQLESLLISVGVSSAIHTPRHPAYDHERFWTTAAKRAALAGRICTHVDPTRRSENFTAALLQDMAIPVLLDRSERYGDIIDYWHNSDEDLTNIELATLGWHHGEVAGWMGACWGFSTDFVDFMNDHHGDSVPHLLPAHLVSPIREADDGGDVFVVEAGVRVLGLSSDAIIAMIEEATIEATSMASLLTDLS